MLSFIQYEGVFGEQFISEIKEGKYGQNEGVVAKGVNAKEHKSEQHGLWYAKVKTKWWLQELKRRAIENPDCFKRSLVDNMMEQEEKLFTPEMSTEAWSIKEK